MAIYVKKINPEEKRKLKKMLKGNNLYLYKRAKAVMLSSEGFTAPKIAHLVDLHFNKIRKWIKRFNLQGTAGLYQKYSPGRPPKISQEGREKIINLLKQKPRDLGLPITSWTLKELAEEVAREKIVSQISYVRIYQIIKEQGYSFKRAKRWITSPDPDYELKKNND